MLGHEQSEVRIVRLAALVLETVSVYGNNTVGILVYDDAVRIHAERAHLVLVFFGGVHDFAFVQLVGNVLEHLRVQLHPDADIHAIGMRGDAQLAAYLLHPFTAASARRHDAVSARIAFIGNHFEAVAALSYFVDVRIEIKVHLALQFGVEIGKHGVVDVRAQMPHLGV